VLRCRITWFLVGLRFSLYHGLYSLHTFRAGLSNVQHTVHWRPHHQALAKIVMLKFVIEVWLKCIIIETTKKGHQFYGQKIVGAPPEQCTLSR